jgi:hypothetical protein
MSAELVRLSSGEPGMDSQIRHISVTSQAMKEIGIDLSFHLPFSLFPSVLVLNNVKQIKCEAVILEALTSLSP